MKRADTFDKFSKKWKRKPKNGFVFLPKWTSKHSILTIAIEKVFHYMREKILFVTMRRVTIVCLDPFLQ